MAYAATFPAWVFDNSPIDDPFGYGERAVKFLKALKHPKSRAKGNAFQLDPWQERIVRRIYGPRHADGRRIVRNVVMLLPRGNRKTSLGAGLALLHSVGPERVPGGQSLFAASDRKQARIGYEEALGIRVLQAKAMKNPRGPVDYFKRRLLRVLTKLLGRPVSFFIGCEIKHGKFHIHGIFDLAPQEFDIALKAFGKALGKWTGRSAKHQFLLRPDPDKYWIDYILKDGSQQEWNPLAVTDNLLKASIAAHAKRIP